MGNCIETCRSSCPQAETKIKNILEEEVSGKDGSMRIKIVLTTEELEWLMLQLQRTGGKKNIEDVLGEIQRCRERSSAAAAWKPSLDSIVEIPEVPEGMDR